MRIFIILLFLPLGLYSQCEQGSATLVTEDTHLLYNQKTDGTIFNAINDNFGLGCQHNGTMKPLVKAMSHWIGGISPDLQLKLAAERYGTEGSDFWPGPLTTDGPASVTLSTCADYDHIIFLKRSWTLIHRAYFDCLNDPGCNELLFFIGGYEIPEAFYQYPAMGNVNDEQAQMLLPFYDYDGNGIYEPSEGDHPLFADSHDCCNSLQGDECTVWIMNDKGDVHSASQGEPIGIEQHHIVYRFYSEELKNAVFHTTRYFNRGTQTLNDTYLGVFVDADIGNGADDYAAFIPEENTALVFNGDFNDEGGNGFGQEAPGLAIRMLRSPFEDPNGQDEDGDGIADNEEIGLVHGLFRDPISPTPVTPVHYYNWMKGFFTNGQVFQDDGEDADYQNEGLPQEEDSIQPTDTRVVMSTGPFTLTPGLEFCTTEVVCWAFPEPGEGPVDAAQRALALSGEIQNLHDNCYPCTSPAVNVTIEQVGNAIQFFNLGAGDSFLWEFSDGTTSTEVYPVIDWDGNATFQITLTVSNECGSVTETIVIDTALDVSELLLDHLLQIYPIPAVSTLQVVVKDHLHIKHTQIYTVGGKLVAEPQLHPGLNRIDIGNLAQGVYILTVHTADGRLLNQRFIK